MNRVTEAFPITRSPDFNYDPSQKRMLSINRAGDSNTRQRVAEPDGRFIFTGSWAATTFNGMLIENLCGNESPSLPRMSQLRMAESS